MNYFITDFFIFLFRHILLRRKEAGFRHNEKYFILVENKLTKFLHY